MSLPRSVADVLDQHVTLELESLDRMYLNVDQPQLQTPTAVFWFLRRFHGEGAVSSHKMRAITERFLSAIENHADEHDVSIISCEIPSLRIDYKTNGIKQDFKEGGADGTDGSESL